MCVPIYILESGCQFLLSKICLLGFAVEIALSLQINLGILDSLNCSAHEYIPTYLVMHITPLFKCFKNYASVDPYVFLVLVCVVHICMCLLEHACDSKCAHYSVPAGVRRHAGVSVLTFCRVWGGVTCCHRCVSWASWPAATAPREDGLQGFSCLSPSSPWRHWDYRCALLCLAFHGFWGPELKSSSLSRKCFIRWAISPAWLYMHFNKVCP